MHHWPWIGYLKVINPGFRFQPSWRPRSRACLSCFSDSKRNSRFYSRYRFLSGHLECVFYSEMRQKRVEGRKQRWLSISYLKANQGQTAHNETREAHAIASPMLENASTTRNQLKIHIFFPIWEGKQRMVTREMRSVLFVEEERSNERQLNRGRLLLRHKVTSMIRALPSHLRRFCFATLMLYCNFCFQPKFSTESSIGLDDLFRNRFSCPWSSNSFLRS